MYTERKNYYSELENARKSKVLVYVTGDRQGWETRIHREVYDHFVEHLDLFGVVPKISLYLYTTGGETLAAWSLVNLIHQFCEQFEVIIPSKSLSAGTLICLGAEKIVMTKQATLGPIDPSVITALNPQIQGAPPEAKFPVSVEAIKGFIQLTKDEMKIRGGKALASVLTKLSENIHPLVLGQAYRSRAQIQMLAKKLIADRMNKKLAKKVIDFLCSESGSHDYTIHRREARNILGLNIETPDDNLYTLIKKTYDDIAKELELNAKFDVNSFLGGESERQYFFKRSLIESVQGGSHYFVSEGKFSRRQIQMPTPLGLQLPQMAFQDTREFEGWKHESI